MGARLWRQCGWALCVTLAAMAAEAGRGGPSVHLRAHPIPFLGASVAVAYPGWFELEGGGGGFAAGSGGFSHGFALGGYALPLMNPEQTDVEITLPLRIGYLHREDHDDAEYEGYEVSRDDLVFAVGFHAALWNPGLPKSPRGAAFDLAVDLGYALEIDSRRILDDEDSNPPDYLPVFFRVGFGVAF